MINLEGIEMPTENEVKYVLRQGLAVIKHLSSSADEVKHITQSYIHKRSKWNVRVRHIIDDHCDEHFVLTYKNQRHGRQIEAEANITKQDYYDLIEQAKVTLSKTRLIFNDADHQWEVDLFLNDDDGVYFIMAEVEMSEGMIEPLSIPDIIQQYIVHNAGYDKAFSSIKIADQQYAEDIYELITSGRYENGKA